MKLFNSKFCCDSILNILAATLPVLCIQLIILPTVASRIGSELYGEMITVISLITISAGTMGNVLNNIRLLYDNQYSELNQNGDFNILLTYLMAINSVVVLGLCVFGFEINFIQSIGILGISICWLLNEYYVVGFRLKLNYRAILVSNLFLAIGYIIGYYLFLYTEVWQYIYFAGYLLSLLYVFSETALWREAIKKTILFKHVIYSTVILLCSKLLNRMVLYMDKIIIYPYLGGETVAVYYVATLLGKIVGLVIGPINNVILSYLTNDRNNKGLFYNTLLISSILCFFGYIFCVLASNRVLCLFYPQYVKEAMNIIYVVTATVVVQTLVTVAEPFVLAYCDIKWQMVLNGVNIVIYIILCIFMIENYGIVGFCYGVLFTSITRIIGLIYVYKKDATI